MSLRSNIKNWVSKTGEFLTNFGKGTWAVWAVATTAWYLFTALSPLMIPFWLPTLALGVTSYATWQILQAFTK